MCLQTGVAFLGPADAVLDLAGRRLLFAPGLSAAKRLLLARRLLAAAGQEQEDEEAVCVCGFGIDVSPSGLAPPAFTLAMRRGGTVRLSLAGREVVVDMKPAAWYRAGDEGPAWDAVRSLVAGEGTGNSL